MKTDNILITEFMGGKYDKDTSFPIHPDDMWLPFHGIVRKQHLNYDKSWDWLMPVIEKIRTHWGNEVILNGDLTIIKKTQGVKTKGFKKIEVLEVGSLNSAYKAVITYIKWYNENEQ
jgi:hypothetical protein